MNKENTEKLFKEFDHLFKDRNNPMKSLMQFGFECDDGWFNIIYTLLKDINKLGHKKLQVVQVKEK